MGYSSLLNNFQSLPLPTWGGEKERERNRDTETEEGRKEGIKKYLSPRKINGKTALLSTFLEEKKK